MQGDTYNLALDVTPIRTSSRSWGLQFLELVEETVPHLDDSR